MNANTAAAKSNKIPLILAVTALVLVAAFLLAARVYKKTESSTAEAQAQSAPEMLIRPYSAFLGPADARVTVVEFLDPECESCRAMNPLVKDLLKEFSNQVRLVVRYMPFHANSVYAATVLEAAKEKGKYWEALDILFERQPEWGDHHSPKAYLIPEYVAGLGITKADITAAMENQEFKRRIDRDRDDGVALGVKGTPTFFVNGKLLEEFGPGPLRSAIEAALK